MFVVYCYYSFKERPYQCDFVGWMHEFCWYPGKYWDADSNKYLFTDESRNYHYIFLVSSLIFGGFAMYFGHYNSPVLFGLCIVFLELVAFWVVTFVLPFVFPLIVLCVLALFYYVIGPLFVISIVVSIVVLIIKAIIFALHQLNI